MVKQRDHMLHDQCWQFSHAVDLSLLLPCNNSARATPAAANWAVSSRPPVHGVAQGEVVLRAAAESWCRSTSGSV